MVLSRVGAHSSKGRVPTNVNRCGFLSSRAQWGGPQALFSTGAVEVVRVVARRHCISFVFAIHGGWCAVSPDTQVVRPLAFQATWKPTFNISSISNITFHVAPRPFQPRNPPTATQPPRRVTWRPRPSRDDHEEGVPARPPDRVRATTTPPPPDPRPTGVVEVGPRTGSGSTHPRVALCSTHSGVSRPSHPATHAGPTPPRGPTHTPRSHSPTTCASATPPHHSAT